MRPHCQKVLNRLGPEPYTLAKPAVRELAKLAHAHDLAPRTSLADGRPESISAQKKHVGKPVLSAQPKRKRRSQSGMSKQFLTHTDDSSRPTWAAGNRGEAPQHQARQRALSGDQRERELNPRFRAPQKLDFFCPATAMRQSRQATTLSDPDKV